MMRGVGGPLLCIGDLLSDIGEVDDDNGLASNLQQPSSSSPLSISFSDSDLNLNLRSKDLPKLFQETFDALNEALAGTDQSWTALTLKLCAALGNAKQLVQDSKSNAGVLSEKIQEFNQIIKRGDAAVAEARAIYGSLN